jgi:predicted deacetylase
MQTRAGNFSSRRYWRINLFCGMGYGKAYLTEMIQEFQRNGIRTSIFVDPRLDMIEGLNKLVQTASNSTLKPLRMNMV